MKGIELPTESDPVRLIHADCRDALRALPDSCIDAVVTDPPYPEIDREYGRWTEAEWFDLMNPVVSECRRVLKPSGSAVFVLQPNSERLGRMRTWLWDFMAKWGREWGVVQDMYWWNYAAPTEAHSIQGRLTKPSIKACVWLGTPDCYRDQDSVLMDFGNWTLKQVGATIARGRDEHPSGHGFDKARMVRRAMERGGSSPYNLLPVANARGHETAGAHGHGAGTPLPLACWWVRYICPRGGIVADPFHGSGTTAKACLAEGRLCLGIERKSEYIAIAEKRLAEPLGTGGLFDTGEPVVASLFD